MQETCALWWRFYFAEAVLLKPSEGLKLRVLTAAIRVRFGKDK